MAYGLEVDELNINVMRCSITCFSTYICVQLKKERIMERQSFKITFYLRRTRLTKAGLAPVLSRVTVNGIAAEIPLKCHIYPERWSQQKERAIGKDKLSIEINGTLDSFRARVFEIRTQIQHEGGDVNIHEIKRRLTESRVTRMFLKELSDYCKLRQKEVGVNITQLTADKFHRTLRYLQEYTLEKYNKQDIPLSSVNYDYVYGFKIFVQTRHNCKNNGAVNLLRALRNFILYCISNEWIQKNPLKEMRLKMEITQVRAHLTKSELEQIISKEMPIERLERVRDVFVFCCLTGLAFTDADHLCADHIGRDDKGNVWIHKPRQKTAIMSIIPLLPYAREILDKYADDNECMKKGKLIPICSNQRMNAYLKELATICNINKLLTTHCARHTFACVAIEYGMPLETIAKVLGHTKVQMTQHYARLSDGAVLRDMVKLNDSLQLNIGAALKKAQ